MIIVNYHNVLAHRPNAFNMLVRKEWLLQKDFARQAAALAERYKVVALAEIVDAVRDGRSIPGACAITFDDGYLGAYEYAVPVLKTLGLPATFFVCTGYVSDDGAPGPDRFDRLEATIQFTNSTSLDLSEFGFGVCSLECDACKLHFIAKYKRRTKTISSAECAAIDNGIRQQAEVADQDVATYLRHEAFRMMDWARIENLLTDGFTVGSHTRTHASLGESADALDDEVRGSFADLAERTGGEGLPFAYPYGKPEHMSEAAIAAVEEAGFSCGLTMVKGANSPDTNVFQLRRVAHKNADKYAVDVS